MAARTQTTLRRAVKSLARGVARLLILPVYLSYRCRRPLLGDQAFRSTSQTLSLIPGTLGDYLRREFYRLTLGTCGKDSVITFGVLLSNPRTRIGENVYIGPYCTIGWADIGNDVLLGADVHVLSGKAQHLSEDVEQLIRLQGSRYERIAIGDDVWVGNGAILMVHVGRKSIVGAGSVVVTDVEDFSVVAGNPARVVKKRV